MQNLRFPCSSLMSRFALPFDCVRHLFHALVALAPLATACRTTGMASIIFQISSDVRERRDLAGRQDPWTGLIFAEWVIFVARLPGEKSMLLVEAENCRDCRTGLETRTLLGKKTQKAV